MENNEKWYYHFYKKCLHCLTTIGGDKAPRPLSEALHDDKPNEISHFDYLNMEDGYLLAIIDDYSSYTELDICHSPSADNT